MSPATRTPRPLARDYTVLAIARRHARLFAMLLAAKARHAHA
jgi:hypothetical protein